MKTYIFFLAMLFPASLLAQSNYQPANVIKKNGDTLKGYINYRDWSRTPKTIEFKSNKEDREAKSFNAGDIRGFSITGMETYISYAGVVTMNRNKFPDLPTQIDTSSAMATIFLKQVVTGKNVTFYTNDDELKIRYFMAETGGTPAELKDYEYYNNYNQVISSSIYKGQLMLYANNFAPENERLKSKISSCTFNQDDFKTIAVLLNGGGSSGPAKRSANRFFVGLAANITKTQVNNLIIFPTTNSGSNTTGAPQVSVGYDFFDNPNVQHFAFRAEADFSLISPQLKFPVQINNANTYEYFNFTQFTTSIIPQFLLNVYNKPDLKVFIAVGVSFNISAYPVDKTSIQTSDPTTAQAYDKQDAYALQTLWATIPLEAGVTVSKNIQVFAVYNLSFASFARSVYDNTGSYSMDFGLRYLFGNK